ncbi:uncharacterized protein CLUP02_11543 [Colletotrichum lupini]|uniref:Uncharacterized protein n=1 Tax=Colletotrichum lupini TaxID=145971 RepID=A0A9Q8SYS7_9PEZI|nr:uncharacterized protein CLUP02_11543 [Colletotrichum lupini]UQC86044.1 hypothetical protein CLUP02_11543 [Colletotrichum lupini]
MALRTSKTLVGDAFEGLWSVAMRPRDNDYWALSNKVDPDVLKEVQRRTSSWMEAALSNLKEASRWYENQNVFLPRINRAWEWNAPDANMNLSGRYVYLVVHSLSVNMVSSIIGVKVWRNICDEMKSKV